MTLLFVLQAAGCVAAASIVLRMLLGPPPARLRPVLALAAGFLGVVGLPVAALLAAGSEPRPAVAVAALAVAALAVGVWASRGPGDAEVGDDGFDWTAFDRERERWERARRE